ncbi:hypothetical protein K440DRAFT_371945 [Wilcoxina mikolae CBS 423.85]|nr:hypothetical protein K440DRAFT_371945 [Wilcoxina mikolae CBS 423.85]
MHGPVAYNPATTTSLTFSTSNSNHFSHPLLLSSSTTSTAMPQPPWKPLILQHLTTLKPPTFSLATLSTNPLPTNPTFSPTPSPPPLHHPALTPRVRTMIYRGFLGTLPENHHNPLISHNPRGVWESDMLTFTTDSRMCKTGELLPDHKSSGNATIGTSGGAEVEMCFWIEATQNQWRIRGRCYLLAEEDADVTPAITDVLKARLKPTGGSGRDMWTWKKEVQSHFGNMAPEMRGGFANPPPGTPLEVDLSRLGEESGGGDKLRKGVVVSNEDVLKPDGIEALARRNFRVGVVVPDMGWRGVETWP